MEAEENGPFSPFYVELYGRVQEHAGRDKNEELLKEVIACVEIIKREEIAKLDQERKAEDVKQTDRLLEQDAQARGDAEKPRIRIQDMRDNEKKK